MVFIRNTILSNAILIVATIFGYCETSPFPQGLLNPEIVDYFYPKIMKETENEFAHQNSRRTNRNTREYGYSYFKMEKGDFSYTPPPEFLKALGIEICLALGHPPREFTNIILSIYEEGFHLSPHIDTNSSDPHHKGYYFDENVYGIIIENDPTGHLYFIHDDVNSIPSLDSIPIYSLEEKPGTIFCLQESYRKAPYFHGVSKVSKQRISITFREVVFDSSGGDIPRVIQKSEYGKEMP